MSFSSAKRFEVLTRCSCRQHSPQHVKASAWPLWKGRAPRRRDPRRAAP